jgi:transcriptional regulator with XRE-family HTH domain
MSDLTKSVGLKIKQKRIGLGLTQNELGMILGCTQQVIQNYEVGYARMPIMMLNDMAILCKVTVDWFFFDEVVVHYIL